MPNYYSVLGVSPDAEHDAIKAQYRKLAKANHPDLNPGNKEAEARFKAIGEAWEILGDADKRAKYDKSRIKTKEKSSTKKKSATPPPQMNMEDLMGQFDAFFGKAMKSDTAAPKAQGPIDVSGLFEKYMGIKRK